MGDITILLQGLFDYWTRLIALFRKHIDYSEMVRSAENLSSVSKKIILDDVKVPIHAVACLLQFVQNNEGWEVLFLDKWNKYLGNAWLKIDDVTRLLSLDPKKLYIIGELDQIKE